MTWFGRWFENRVTKFDSKRDGDFDAYCNSLLEDKPPEDDERGTLNRLIGLFGAPMTPAKKDGGTG